MIHVLTKGSCLFVVMQYVEALDDKGKVAFKGSYDDDHAKSHGWATCNRCYEGECQTFTWEM